MNMYTRKDALAEIKRFDGTEECAQMLIKWAGSSLKQATTVDGEIILLVNTFGDSWLAIDRNSCVLKAHNGYIIPLSEEVFNNEYVEV